MIPGMGGGTSLQSSSSATSKSNTDSTGSTSGGGFRLSPNLNFSLAGSSLSATASASEAGKNSSLLLIGLAGVALFGVFMWFKFRKG